MNGQSDHTLPGFLILRDYFTKIMMFIKTKKRLKDQERQYKKYRQINTRMNDDTLRFGKATVVVLGGKGTVLRSFNISPVIFIKVSIMLLLYVFLSIFLIISFVDLRSRYQAQSRDIKRFEDSRAESENRYLQAEQHAINLMKYIETLEDKKELPPANNEAGKTVVKENRRNVEAEIDKELVQSKSVDIEDFKVVKLDVGKVAIDFRLSKTTEGNAPIRGYVHVLSMDGNNSLSTSWNESKISFKNGIPSNFRDGQSFNIQRFKNCDYEIKYDPSMGDKAPSSVRILVYDYSGKLILNRTFDVDNAS